MDSHAWPTTLRAACDPHPERCLLLDAGATSIDCWGLPVYYTRKSGGFEIRSLGPDQKPGSSDDLVLSYPLDRLLARRVAGCYEPRQGWWKSSPTPIRLDTLPGKLYNAYALWIEVPLGSTHFREWFPVTADSVVLQWAQGSHLHMLRLRLSGDTLRGRFDSDLLNWRGSLKLVRINCQ